MVDRALLSSTCPVVRKGEMPMSNASREPVSLRLVSAAAAAVVVGLGIISHANATPYASGISNAGGNVTFTLNEDAGDVTAIVNGTPTDLGALTRGTHSF